jgi:hypothetical protein
MLRIPRPPLAYLIIYMHTQYTRPTHVTHITHTPLKHHIYVSKSHTPPHTHKLTIEKAGKKQNRHNRM